MRQAAGSALVIAPALLLCWLGIETAVSAGMSDRYAVGLASSLLVAVCVAAWVHGERIASAAGALLSSHRREVRIFTAISITWALSVLAYVWTFEPFGGFVSDGDWITVTKTVLIPPLLVLLAFALSRWASAKH